MTALEGETAVPLPARENPSRVQLSSIPVPAEWIEALNAHIDARVSAALDARTAPPWIRGADAAAAYLGCPVSRVYALTSARRIPHEKDGSALLFRRAALDAFIAEGGAVRP